MANLPDGRVLIVGGFSGFLDVYPRARIYDPVANLPEDVVREAAWNAAGIAFNPQAAFPRYAREHDLGVPQTEEFDFSYKGINYRGQGFGKAIVFAKVGDWGNVKEMNW